MAASKPQPPAQPTGDIGPWGFAINWPVIGGLLQYMAQGQPQVGTGDQSLKVLGQATKVPGYSIASRATGNKKTTPAGTQGMQKDPIVDLTEKVQGLQDQLTGLQKGIPDAKQYMPFVVIGGIVLLIAVIRK